ncbi:MAG: HAMP domain-containing sensor histidine kinase [Eubacteriales bacterium]|nr:HAMP domain-containing sensor histidine kinase [Eubacteriales bacterium]
MKSTTKLIKRLVLTLMISLIVLLALNIILMITVTSKNMGYTGGWTMAQKLAESLTENEGGGYELGEDAEKMLEDSGAWAILIQDGTGDVIWHSQNLPEKIPLHYSAAEISWYTRGYIEDYPMTASARGEDLVMVGNPKDSYWKAMQPTFSLELIRNFPRNLLLFAGVNLAIITAIYIIATSGILRSVKPIVQGIEALPEGREVYVKEKGLLSDLSGAINRVSEKLRSQEYEIRKKEQARADWIAGVSHDIRTPLSMVMGYAAEIEDETEVPEEVKRRANIIRLQSVRIRNLVNDLNLSSRLEYCMQPVKLESVNLAGLVRETAADFMNSDMEGKYPVELLCEPETDYRLMGDRELLKRAFSNLLLNAQIHNPEGCNIRMELSGKGKEIQIDIEDDGVGVTEEQLERLKHTPHYMLSDSRTGHRRHGLGLLIVQQILAAHNGRVAFGHGRNGGFRVEIFLNRSEEHAE